MPSIRDIIYNKAPHPKKDKKALVCVDYANWVDFLWTVNRQISWKNFKSFIESMYAEVLLYFYYGTITPNYWKVHHPHDSMKTFEEALKKREMFFEKLTNLGYIVRTKPIAMMYGKPKCNFDVEIAIDIMVNINNFDVLVLCSGDGDFLDLVRRLKGDRKQVHVISSRKQFNSQLKATATMYDYLDNLVTIVPDLSEKKIAPP